LIIVPTLPVQDAIKMKTLLTLFLAILTSTSQVLAGYISANASNYTSYLSGLQAGDTLFLAEGNYINQLNLSNKNGTSTDPIVIMGDGNGTVFLGNACCNTVNLTDCSYLVIRNFKIDGQNINYIDGVKAGGGGNHFAHHITLEDLYIVNNGGNIEGDNQTVGISTKCAAWSWTIRNCIIIAAGTGLYLGNSDGTSPFVSGLIENNLVINTRGYNMQIKAQNNGVRDIFPGTAVDSQKTIVRYNVWSKDTGSTPIGTGDGSRPCVLLGHFPPSGNGSHDTYEVYGNFFYNNPTEALIQITANTALYNNLFVNHVAPQNYGTVVITNHEGFPPRDIKVFHNTVLSTSMEGGIGLYGPNTSYQQYGYANAVFSSGAPIMGFTVGNMVDNITDTYSNANAYLTSPTASFPNLDLYPLSGQLQGVLTSSSLMTGYSDFNIDFNGDPYDWRYRGAYSGEGINGGWVLLLDIMPTPHGTITSTHEDSGTADFIGLVYANPVSNGFQLDAYAGKSTDVTILLADLEGRPIQRIFNGNLVPGKNTLTVGLPEIIPGFYLLMVRTDETMLTKKILIQ
jgi:hypothetical protein